MANIVFTSRNRLGTRRRQLRRQRRLKLVRVIWQVLAVGGISGGVFWGISQPIWLIKEAEQVEIKGNQLLSQHNIRSHLPLSYPQSVWQIQPSAIQQALIDNAPISEAIVIRQVFPPRLTIEVTEREPVAIAQPPIGTTTPGTEAIVGWLDAEGSWMPLSSYTELEQTGQLPNLRVIGNFEIYQPHWQQVYSDLSRSPVDIYEIDWQNPANIILMTEIGEVHIGSYSTHFWEQLQVIDRMRKLPEQVDVSQVDYIDLRNPNSPLVLMISDQSSLSEASFSK
ncbi:MAG: FtsQ-type POTRA domain-containing protein [Limnospira sp. PMC 894.15]|uniref:FtsQ-type POTRA domain-containing protein n=1 Tax=Limnospira fusiformis PMC 851.14 TaxID=2219512 RepID=A0ABU9ERS6_LIMFS|nr:MULTISPECIES: FtsQ-type POTRA domain-containing protein [Limnospira]MDT9186551.1 FtsQ-type POTRA domain-containing protein [Limnospira sp. PMC 894.15]MDT9232459.1 FtsQ-type POTRA domain-containing protein [Limnospira sp. PMC 917.15]MDT9273387.1 FtsQ-type POTRA domain-containing protein [Limnospira sp. PMC 737.11]QNH59708.1 MAG: FtsQ-type POTRA domain-containing protein [Limnospira indica BM01]